MSGFEIIGLFFPAVGIVGIVVLAVREVSLRLGDRRRVRYLERTERLYRRDAVVFDWDEPADRARLGRLGQ